MIGASALGPSTVEDRSQTSKTMNKLNAQTCGSIDGRFLLDSVQAMLQKLFEWS